MEHHDRSGYFLSRRAALAAGAAAFMAPALGRADEPALLISGGTIYTGARTGVVEAVAFRGDRIAFVGSLADARRAVPGARAIDLGGASAFPGFVDSHVHLTGVGIREMTLSLEGTASIAELQAHLATWAKANPAGAINGRG